MKFFIGVETQVEVQDEDEAQELADRLVSELRSADPRVIDAWEGHKEEDFISNEADEERAAIVGEHDPREYLDDIPF